MSLYDENFEVLFDLARRGVDLSLPRAIGFGHLFPNEEASRRFALKLSHEAISVTLSERPDGGGWEALVTMTAVPACDFISDTERRLDVIARAFGGRADGWGFAH